MQWCRFTDFVVNLEQSQRVAPLGKYLFKVNIKNTRNVFQECCPCGYNFELVFPKGSPI